MQTIIFQIIGIVIGSVAVVQFVRQQRKSGDMPFKKYWLPYIFWAWCLGCFAYGIVFYIDAPLHESTPQQPCAIGQFCGKTGKPHTKEEFEAFIAWQKIFVFSFIVGFIWMAAAKSNSKMKKPEASAQKNLGDKPDASA